MNGLACSREHTTLAERYVEVGVIMDEHPGIHFVAGALGRRPRVLGTGLDVWEIVGVAKDNTGSVTDTAAYVEIDPRLVETAPTGSRSTTGSRASTRSTSEKSAPGARPRTRPSESPADRAKLVRGNFRRDTVGWESGRRQPRASYSGLPARGSRMPY